MLKDPNKCGLVVWGTKLGEYLFHMHNLNNDNYQVRKTLKDVRKRLNVNGLNQVFYSYEAASDCHSFTVYRTIRDWSDYGKSRGRDGYFAVSVFVSKQMCLLGTDLVSLLNDLNDHYWDNYVIKTGAVDQYRIDKSRKEDFAAMERMVDRVSLRRQSTGGVSDGENKVGKKFYDHSAGLGSGFDDVFQGAYAAYASLIWMPSANAGDFKCSYEDAKAAPKRNLSSGGVSSGRDDDTMKKSISDKISSYQQSLREQEKTTPANQQDIRHSQPDTDRHKDQKAERSTGDDAKDESLTDADGKKINKNLILVLGGVAVGVILVIAFLFMAKRGDEVDPRKVAMKEKLDNIYQQAATLPTTDPTAFIELSKSYRETPKDFIDDEIDTLHRKIAAKISDHMKSVIEHQITNTDFPFQQTANLVKEVFLIDSTYNLDQRPPLVNQTSQLPQKLWAYYRACTWIKRAKDYDANTSSKERLCNVMYVIKHYLLKLRARQDEFTVIPDLPWFNQVTKEVESNDPEGIAGRFVRLHIDCAINIREINNSRDPQLVDRALRSWEDKKSTFEGADASNLQLYADWQAQNIYQINKAP